MRSVLMLGPVRGIAEGFCTARKLAHVRLLSGVRSEMSLQILQPRVRLWAAFKLIKTQRCNFNIIPTYIVWDALLSIFIKFLNTSRYRHCTWQVTSIFLKFNTHYKEIYFIYYTEGLGSNINIYFFSHFSGRGVIKIQHTVHLWGFSPVWRLMCTTNMYWALNGFSSRLHSFQRQMNIFLLACMWSIFICYNEK